MSQPPDSPVAEEETVEELERQVAALTERLNRKRREASGSEVRDYSFRTLEGETRLSELFADKDKLLAIHNMGQACRYCTLWADGINGILPHLESAMAVVLVSKDAPEDQRRFASSRGWRFRLASHLGGAYMRDQSTSPDHPNAPGTSLYEKRDGKILRKNAVAFGPGDMFCSMWNLLALAGMGADSWTPQFSYWKRPSRLDDGGLNVLE